MAYRAPRYSFSHAARDVGASAITVSDTAHTDYPKDNLLDDRAGTIFKWSAVVTDPTIAVDLGSGFVTGLDRIIIPANHNVVNVKVEQADDSGFSVNLSTLKTATVVTAGSQIDLEFTASTRQFIRITFTGGPTQYYLSQLVLTEIKALTVGPDLANSPDGFLANATQIIQNNGMRPSIQHGPQQRVIEYSYAPIEGANLTTMKALIAAVGVTVPFYVDPASFSATPATDDPPLWMKFETIPREVHTVLVPMNENESKEFVLRLIESVD